MELEWTLDLDWYTPPERGHGGPDISGGELRILRESLCMTRPDLATYLGCDDSTVLRWELNRAAVRPSAVIAVIDLAAWARDLAAGDVEVDEVHRGGYRRLPGGGFLPEGWYAAAIVAPSIISRAATT